MGFSSGSSSNQSSSSSYGYNQSLAQSMQSVFGPQVAPLTDLYGDARGLMNAQEKTAGKTATRLLGQTMPAAQFGLSQMQQFANPNSALAQRQSSLLADQIGQDFGRTILPQIRTGAGIGGNMGGSREALAKGVAAGDAASAIAQGSTDFFSHQYDLANQAASSLPGMAGNVFNLGMMPLQAAWMPLQQMAQIMGGPTVLGRSQALSQGENIGQSQSIGSSRQFGFNLW